MVSLFAKFHVNEPAVVGEQMFNPSFILPVKFAENVIMLSLKQANWGALETSVEPARAVLNFQDDFVMSSVFVGGVGAGVSFLSQLVKKNAVKQNTVARISLFIVLNLVLKVVKVFGLFEPSK